MPGSGDADTSIMRAYLCVLVLILFLALSLPAQESSTENVREPAWIIMERAQRAYEAGELGVALQLYGEALADQPLLIEARLGMARVYRAQGDFQLAERMYRQTLDNAGQLDVPDDRYGIILELAALYDDLDEAQAAENELRKIILEDTTFIDESENSQRNRMMIVLKSAGVDRVIVLYRLDFPQALEAHRRLAGMLLRRDDVQMRDEALAHALFSVVEIIGRGVQAIIDRDPSYQFRSIAQFERDAVQYPAVDRYLAAVDFTGALNLLRRALIANSDEAYARHADAIRR